MMVNAAIDIEKSLQDALPEQRFTVKTHFHKDELILIINRARRAQIDYNNLVKVIEYNLLNWQLEGIKKIKIFGRMSCESKPEWYQVLDLEKSKMIVNGEGKQMINLEGNNQLISNILKALKNKKIKDRGAAKLMRIKLALICPCMFAFIDGVWMTGQSETQGYVLLLVSAVMATGLAVVEAIDILRKELRHIE
ncbi:MAG: hypothetical protein N3E45_15780 [Oscillatoriaceae bacterium SKW80]|nr:hypothetical protein [Oscillatoriaceae bacterium SKW80]HIK29406.1 hypothetical protein [Oscillatoriaceae cyanobacterium M7585_C2015_266]